MRIRILISVFLSIASLATQSWAEEGWLFDEDAMNIWDKGKILFIKEIDWEDAIMDKLMKRPGSFVKQNNDLKEIQAFITFDGILYLCQARFISSGKVEKYVGCQTPVFKD